MVSIGTYCLKISLNFGQRFDKTCMDVDAFYDSDMRVLMYAQVPKERSDDIEADFVFGL